MSKKNKKQKYCPACQNKQRIIEKLEHQLLTCQAKLIQP